MTRAIAIFTAIFFAGCSDDQVNIESPSVPAARILTINTDQPVTMRTSRDFVIPQTQARSVIDMINTTPLKATDLKPPGKPLADLFIDGFKFRLMTPIPGDVLYVELDGRRYTLKNGRFYSLVDLAIALWNPDNKDDAVEVIEALAEIK